MKTILLRRADDSVAVMTLIPIQGKYETVENVLAKWPEAERAAIVSWEPIARSDIPSDRTFRNAWKAEGQKIGHDMEKCRAIHRENLRALRAPKLAALDVEYQRADEGGDNEKKKDIAKRKQALRDVTADPAIVAAKTPDELKAAIPHALQSRDASTE
jgi:hypothetical protein